ncbi:hypothetical protein HYY75_04070, partial [bacterium]|nr:hypothetical protein [bacterium]
MIGKNVQKVEPVWETQTSKEIFLSEAAKRTSVSLQAWKGKENLTREATQADLVRIGNLFVESFSQTKTPDQLRFFGNFRQSELYLQSLEKTLSENITGVPVQRSDAVIFLFRLISDLFEIQPPEEASDRYSDIPKYHYINLPIDTLEGLGLHLGRETSVFGGEDSVSL